MQNRTTRRELNRLLLGALAGGATAFRPGPAAAHQEAAFVGERSEERILLKSPAGSPILEYIREPAADAAARPAVGGACYTHPVRTPAGELVTDLAPKDHPHHRGIFFAWVEVAGEERGDWWGWGARAPKEDRIILNREARVTDEDRDHVAVRAINSWRAGEETVLNERVSIQARLAPGCHVLDYEYKFSVPTMLDVAIAPNPFGGFCCRLRSGGRLTVSGPDGRVDRPDAVFDRPDTNWPAARWYDFSYQPTAGRGWGVAVLDHPLNPPTTW
ncbi:MAG: hypothetical protein FJX77_07450, partial [Armatimonadetes bacterium]|nr:hypothetical protein [Armatimonadota bacterium]